MPRGLQALGTHRLPAHLFRAVAGLTAMYCFFYALAHLHLAEAVILNYSSPLFIAVFALLLLGERANRRLVAAIVIGLLGVGMIVKPGTGVWSPAALIGLASGVFAALAMVGIRHLSATEPTRRIVFYFCLFGTLFSAVPMLWAWQAPSLEIFAAMALAGTGATAAQLLLTKSYSLVPAAQVGPYTYASVIFAALFGWLLWNETPESGRVCRRCPDRHCRHHDPARRHPGTDKTEAADCWS
ncbi:MAG: DMT family transporter [Gammaproteobacteria bacterium]|nr:DMT family transporter [Gammaproteobacteria bacterium]